MTKTTDRLAEVQDYFGLCHALIQEAKGVEGDQSYVTNHLDDAENWLDKIEVVTQSLSADLDKAQQQLKTVLDREAETHRRHDAKVDVLEGRIAELEGESARLREDTEMAVDNAATFCIEHLATMLGTPDYVASDGSEAWEGDVAGTINNVLIAARVLDPWDFSFATHETFHEERAALNQPKESDSEG